MNSIPQNWRSLGKPKNYWRFFKTYASHIVEASYSLPLRYGWRRVYFL